MSIEYTAPQHLTRVPSAIWGDESQIVDAAFTWAANRAVRASDPKTTARQAGDLDDAAGVTVTPEGIGHAEAMRIFEDVLVPATRAQDDPLNLAYIPAAPTRAAVAFDAVVSSANIFGGMWEAGAGGIWAENQAIAWITGLLGWPESAGGCFVSGGTSGNLSALAAARHTARKKRGGERPAGGWKVACTTTAHSSIQSAANLLDADVVDVEVDERGHMTGDALRAAFEADPDIFAVVASAGTTNAGIIDDLADIADVCEEYGAWLHVDGAYGGAGLAAPSVRSRYRGIERADSFIVDPHKWLFAPYDCCALIYRDPSKAMDAHSQHASYLDMVDRDEWNPSDLAAHLSRRVRGLPLWFSLATHGTDRYTAAVERTLETAREVTEAIRGLRHLELVVEPELSVIVFRRIGWDDAAYARWSKRMAVEGIILCIPTKYEGETVLRLAFVNPETDPVRVAGVLATTMRDDAGH
ncbi:pyridoxal phosphate-dependent decarboxylase family protein [Actinomycetota bacterium]